MKREDMDPRLREDEEKRKFCFFYKFYPWEGKDSNYFRKR
jgi:hypothetical protein